MQKKLLVAALASGAFDAAFGAPAVAGQTPTKSEELFAVPKSREQKLQAMGLTVNSKETATAVRYGYGQKPPVETDNCRAAQRRVRQMKKLAEKNEKKAAREAAQNCLPQTATA